MYSIISRMRAYACICGQARNRRTNVKFTKLNAMAKKEKNGTKYQEVEIKVTDQMKTHEKDIFLILEHNGVYLIALTNKIVSKSLFNTIEEAEAYIDSKPWELILNATAVMMNIINQDKQ